MISIVVLNEIQFAARGMVVVAVIHCSLCDVAQMQSVRDFCCANSNDNKNVPNGVLGTNLCVSFVLSFEIAQWQISRTPFGFINLIMC